MNHASSKPHAFTLTELLVVISIFVIVLAIAVPSFTSMLYSSEQSLAENSMRQGLAAARDAAIRNPAGQDAAAVFTFEPGGRAGIVPVVFAGVTREPASNAGEPARKIEVFVPVSGFEPVQLPRGWSIRGYARPGTLDEVEWYEDTYTPERSNPGEGNWVFPETSFYDGAQEGQAGTREDQGQARQSFMVRFEGGTGRVVGSNLDAVLVLLPSPATVFRSRAPWTTPDPASGQRYLNVARVQDYRRFVQAVLARPVAGTVETNGDPNALTVAGVRSLVGTVSSDTVLCKPVTELAVYSESRLAAGLGVRLDRGTQTIYRDVAPLPAAQRFPQWVDGTSGEWARSDTENLNDWIEGRLVRNGNPIASDARVFVLARSLGAPVEVTGTATPGQGVAP